jgi:hypothetical protein
VVVTARTVDEVVVPRTVDEVVVGPGIPWPVAAVVVVAPEIPWPVAAVVVVGPGIPAAGLPAIGSVPVAVVVSLVGVNVPSVEDVGAPTWARRLLPPQAPTATPVTTTATSQAI